MTDQFLLHQQMVKTLDSFMTHVVNLHKEIELLKQENLKLSREIEKLLEEKKSKSQ